MEYNSFIVVLCMSFVLFFVLCLCAVMYSVLWGGGCPSPGVSSGSSSRAGLSHDAFLHYIFLVKARVTSCQFPLVRVYVSLTKKGNDTSRPPTLLVNWMSLYATVVLPLMRDSTRITNKISQAVEFQLLGLFLSPKLSANCL